MSLQAYSFSCALSYSAVWKEIARTHSLVGNLPESVQSDLAGSQLLGEQHMRSHT